MTGVLRTGGWGRLVVGIVAIGVLAAFSGLCKGDASESAVWGKWPLLPWDGKQVMAKDWAELLNRSPDLSRRGKPGERRRYEMRRINLNLDRKGQALGRMVAEGRVARTLLREVESGLWAERIEWERFAVASSQGPAEYPTPQELASARGIAYEFSPRDFNYINPPGDFARLGDEMTGYFMKVMAMDLSGWDAMVLGIRNKVGPEGGIGSAWREPRWQEGREIGRAVGEGAAGRYQLGEMRVEIAGITRWRGEPCTLIWCSAEGNEVKQDFGNAQFAVRMHGTEYFRAMLAVSLLDGHLVAGELWGPVQCLMELGFGGQPPQEQPIAAVLQQVSIWEVSEP